MGLINKEFTRHPLHLTMGHITTFGKDGENEVSLLARVLEATGYATTGGRLLRPYKTGKHCWNVKSVGGILERDADEIQLGVDRAVEFRTFQLQSLTSLDRFFRS